MKAPLWKRPAFALCVGALAGTLSGLLGIGGGLIVGPALVLAGIPLSRALGTALVVVAPVAAVAVVAELLTDPGHLAWWPAACIMLGGQIGAPAGAWMVARMPDRALRYAFLVLVLYAALRNFGAIGGPPPDAVLAGVAGGSEVLRYALCFGLGILAGICSSLFGIGGGVVVVPGLIYAVGGFLFHGAAGTSLLAMVPTSARAAFLAGRQGRLERGVAATLVPTAVVAAIGAVLLRNLALEPGFLVRVFGVFLLYVALRLALPQRGPAPGR